MLLLLVFTSARHATPTDCAAGTHPGRAIAVAGVFLTVRCYKPFPPSHRLVVDAFDEICVLQFVLRSPSSEKSILTFIQRSSQRPQK